MSKKARDSKKINEASHCSKRSRNIELSHISSPLSYNDNTSVSSKKKHSSNIVIDVLPSKKNDASPRTPKRSHNIESYSPLPNNANASVNLKRNHSSVRSYTYPVSKKQRTPEK